MRLVPLGVSALVALRLLAGCTVFNGLQAVPADAGASEEDASTLAEAFSCAGLPEATFCTTFDDATLSEWDTPFGTDGVTAVDGAESLSPPTSLLSTVRPSTEGGAVGSRFVYLARAADAARVELSFAMRIETPLAEEATTFARMTLGSPDTSDAYVVFLNVNRDSVWANQTSGGGDPTMLGALAPAPSRDTWARFVLQVTRTNPPKVSLHRDGRAILNDFTGTAPTPPGAGAALELGVVFAHGPAAEQRLRFDDVLVRALP